MKKTISLLMILAMLFSCIPFASAEDDYIDAGVLEDNVYWNESISLGCALDEDWYFLTLEEILEVNGYAFDQIEGDIGEMLQNMDNMTCMYALNMRTNETANVNIEKLSIANAVVLTEKKYLELSSDMLVELLEQMGDEDVAYEISEVEIDGETHAAMNVSFKNNGIDVFEQLVAIKKGGRMIVITAVSYVDNTTDEILAGFFRTAPEAA